MGSKIKLTVTIDKDLAKEIDDDAKARKISRSSLVEEGIKSLRKKQVEDALKKGYSEMAEENLKVAEETIGYGEETFDEE